MKKALFLLIGLLLVVSTSWAQSWRPVELSFSFMDSDSGETTRYFGPFDVSGCWTANNLGLTQDGAQDSSWVLNLQWACLATDTGTGVPKFTVTRYLSPFMFKSPGSATSKKGVSAFSNTGGGTNYNDYVKADSLALFSTVVSKDSTLLVLDRVESSITGAKPYMYLKIAGASGNDQSTRVYLSASCIDRRKK